VEAAPLLGAVVLMVKVTGTFMVEELSVTVEVLKVQVLLGGKFEHNEDESAAEPVNPFCAVNMRIVDPDCPWLATVIAVGLALIENVGGAAPILITVAVEVEAL
jgi:hypothetical protein